MEQWLSIRLSECLGFPVPEEMIEYELRWTRTHCSSLALSLIEIVFNLSIDTW